MIRHVVMFRWKAGVDDAHVQATADALRGLPAQIPEILSYSCGPDLGVAATNFDFAVTAQFSGTDDFVTYRDHPAHQAVVQALIAPFVDERCAVQFSAV
jgi:Stress responsive A/B Barrel Domain